MPYTSYYYYYYTVYIKFLFEVVNKFSVCASLPEFCDALISFHYYVRHFEEESNFGTLFFYGFLMCLKTLGCTKRVRKFQSGVIRSYRNVKDIVHRPTTKFSSLERQNSKRSGD